MFKKIPCCSHFPVYFRSHNLPGIVIPNQILFGDRAVPERQLDAGLSLRGARVMHPHRDHRTVGRTIRKHCVLKITRRGSFIGDNNFTASKE